MNTATRIQQLRRFREAVKWVVGQAGKTRAHFDVNSVDWNDCLEVQKMLQQIVVQVDLIMDRLNGNPAKYRNLRQAEDFALKSQLAKARNAVASALEDVEDGHSHK